MSITAVLLHPLHKDLTTIFVLECIVDVELIFASPALDRTQIEFIILPQSSLDHALYVEKQASFVIFGRTLTGVDQCVIGCGADAADLEGIYFVIEDYFGLLDLKMMQL
jgi:hypothetical protein